jgi:uncharacterized membrane protein YeiH
VIQFLDFAGTAVFAVSGALAAGRKRMDAFGVVVLGCVTAVGGGTVRDVLLGSQPVFWMIEPWYLAVAALAALATFAGEQSINVPARALLYADALGLAVFAVIGAEKSLAVNGSYAVAVVMGVTTAVVGGMIRDVLSGEVPLILRQEIYATAALCGATVLVGLLHLGVGTREARLISILVTLAIRLSAVRWSLSLPVFLPRRS